MLPRSVFVGADVLQFGAYDAVAHFNIGAKAAMNVFTEMGLVPVVFFRHGIRKADQQRVKKAEHRNLPAVKKRRKVLRGSRKKKEDGTQEREGATYKAGAF